MEYTRVDTKKLKAAIDKAVDHIQQAKAALDPYLGALTDDERASLAHPPTAFSVAGRALARAAVDHPEVAAVSGYDSDAVIEDLDNTAALAPLLERLSELTRLVGDTRLTWLSEAWVPSLALYAVAKVKARTDGAIRALVDPLAGVFAAPRRRSKAAPTPPNG